MDDYSEFAPVPIADDYSEFNSEDSDPNYSHEGNNYKIQLTPSNYSDYMDNTPGGIDSATGLPMSNVKAIAALRGFGQGVSANVSTPLTALVRSAMTYNEPGSRTRPGYTFDQALADTRSENDSYAQTQPGAYFGGQLAGAGVLGTALPGSTVPKLMASGAAISGINAATQEGATPGSILSSAGSGAAISGVIGGAGTGLAYLANTVGIKAATEYIQELINKVNVGSGSSSTQATVAAQNALKTLHTINPSVDSMVSLNDGSTIEGGLNQYLKNYQNVVNDFSNIKNVKLGINPNYRANELAINPSNIGGNLGTDMWNTAKAAGLGLGTDYAIDKALGKDSNLPHWIAPVAGAIVGGSKWGAGGRESAQKLATDAIAKGVWNPSVNSAGSAIRQGANVGANVVNQAVPQATNEQSPLRRFIDSLDPYSQQGN